jgi:ADP-ribose pyrophosphatase YjhB (NUDIX family)
VLELDEDITTSLRREALEETGLEVEPVTLTGVYKNMSRPIVALVFRCKPTGGQLTLNDEVTAFRWVTVSEVAEAADEAFAVRVTDALADSPSPAVRQHDGTHLL